MAKTTKSAKSDRQAVIEQMRKKQKGAERRRGFAILGVCLAIAAAILAYPIYGIVTDAIESGKYDDLAVDEIGAPADACQDVTTKKADGNQNHVPTGTPVDYSTTPPAYGAHWNEAGTAPAPFDRKFYTAEDRPALESLVHNLEHGYTILWYDETIADDEQALDDIEGIAGKYGDSNFRDKFIAAPWTSDDEDGADFPDGQHIAFTHWSAGGQGVTDTTKQVGAFQYCSEVSGEALASFMEEYPYLDSPEPSAM